MQQSPIQLTTQSARECVFHPLLPTMATMCIVSSRILSPLSSRPHCINTIYCFEQTNAIYFSGSSSNHTMIKVCPINGVPYVCVLVIVQVNKWPLMVLVPLQRQCRHDPLCKGANVPLCQNIKHKEPPISHDILFCHNHHHHRNFQIVTIFVVIVAIMIQRRSGLLRTRSLSNSDHQCQPQLSVCAQP